MASKDLGGIIYSSYTKVNWSGEDFITEHAVGYIIRGGLSIIDGEYTKEYRDGDTMFFRKNNLAKFVKHPAVNGDFFAITVKLEQDALLQHANGQAGKQITQPTGAVLPLPTAALLKSYFDSLIPYFDADVHGDLIAAKKQELILLLLRQDASFGNILFDFGAPGKIDLEAFMKRNFRYNVTQDKLAFLTGRSLATFKRDFEKAFGTSPNKWIQEQRLRDAYYLIHDRKVRPSDAYLQVGFESLSHFSYAFKQYFGKNPSEISVKA